MLTEIKKKMQTMKCRVTMKTSTMKSLHMITWMNLTGHLKTQHNQKKKV